MLYAVLLTSFYLLLFNILLYRFGMFQLPRLKPWLTLALFNLKFLAGVFSWAVYTFYYTDVKNNDVHKYYSDAVILQQYGVQNPLSFAKVMVGDDGALDARVEAAMKNWHRNFDEAPFNENRTVIKLNAFLLFFSFNTYFVHILFMCFISLIGIILLIQAVFHHSSNLNVLYAIPVLFLPSVLLWGSGVMKEPLLIFGLGIYVYALIRFRLSVKYLLLLATGALVLLMVKFYVLICLLPASFAYLLFRESRSLQQVVVRYISISLLLLVSVLMIPKVLPTLNPIQILVNKQQHAVKEASYFKAGSAIAIPEVSDELSLIAAAPAGLWNVFMRPYLTECKNVMMLLSGVETILIWLLLLSLLYRFRWTEQFDYNLFFFLLVSSLLYFMLIGVTSPVLGNLVRYKAPMLPMFMFAWALAGKPLTLPAFCHYLFLRKA